MVNGEIGKLSIYHAMLRAVVTIVDDDWGQICINPLAFDILRHAAYNPLDEDEGAVRKFFNLRRLVKNAVWRRFGRQISSLWVALHPIHIS